MPISFVISFIYILVRIQQMDAKHFGLLSHWVPSHFYMRKLYTHIYLNTELCKGEVVLFFVSIVVDNVPDCSYLSSDHRIPNCIDRFESLTAIELDSIVLFSSWNHILFPRILGLFLKSSVFRHWTKIGNNFFSQSRSPWCSSQFPWIQSKSAYIDNHNLLKQQTKHEC